MLNIFTVEYKRREGESEYEYIYRIGQLKDVIGTWQDVADVINSELGWEFSESKYRKDLRSFSKMFEANKNTIIPTDTYTQSLMDLKRDIQTERYKLQAEKMENNRWLRENARDELITEKIVNAVQALAPVEVPEMLPIYANDRAAVLAFGDAHYGCEFVIKGLFGEVLNEYSPEIFESRMWNLLGQVKKIVEKERLTTLHVYDLADQVDGVLRVGQIFKLRYGVVESTIKYAEFICNWLNDLSKFVVVRFQSCLGNHCELRMLGQPKGTFKNENMGFVIKEFIKTRLADNPNFYMNDNPTNLIYDELLHYHILGIHGEARDMERAIKDLSNTYNTSIDFLIGGHKHHGATEVVGVDKEVIRIPSIIGIDDFSMSINKTSCAGATLFILEEGKGKTIQYDIKLN